MTYTDGVIGTRNSVLTFPSSVDQGLPASVGMEDDLGPAVVAAIEMQVAVWRCTQRKLVRYNEGWARLALLDEGH